MNIINWFSGVELPEKRGYKINKFISALEKEDFSGLTINQLSYLHTCFCKLRERGPLLESQNRLYQRLTKEFLVKNREAESPFLSSRKYVNFFEHVESENVEQYLLALHRYALNEPLLEIAKEAARKNFPATLKHFSFTRLAKRDASSVFETACNIEANALEVLNAIVCDEPEQQQEADVEEEADDVEDLVENESIASNEDPSLPNQNRGRETIAVKLAGVRLTVDQRFGIAEKIIRIAPETFCQKIQRFALDKQNRYKLAEILKTINRSVLEQNLDCFQLSDRKIKLLGLAPPSDKVARRAPIKKTKLVALRYIGSENLSKLIKEHALRRIDFLFYTLIFCHNDPNYQYELAPTRLQYLQGSNDKNTRGCHSTILPGIKRRTRNPAGEWDENFFLDIYFSHCANSTMELPEDVNKVDSALEGKNILPSSKESWKLRHYAREILQKVANPKQETSVQQGLSDFLNHFEAIAQKVKVHYQEKHPERIPHIEDQLSALPVVAQKVEGKWIISNEYLTVMTKIAVSSERAKALLTEKTFWELPLQDQKEIYQEIKKDMVQPIPARL